MVAAAAAKTMAATVMGGGTDNNQLKVAAEETTVAEAMKIAMAAEKAMVTATKTTRLKPTMGHQQQQ